MSERISDERLRELTCAYRDAGNDWDRDIRSVLLELLSLREQKKRLIADGERLADEIRDKLYPDNDGNIELVLHDTFLKDLEELEECQRPIFNPAATLNKLEDELENE